MKKKSNTFFKIFFSLVFTFLVAFYFTRSENHDESYRDYFSKLLHNFSISAQDAVAYQTIENWFSPTLKADEREKFIQYKLTILSKSIGQYFKNLLRDTQDDLLSQDLKRSLKQIGLANLNASKQVLKSYIKKKSDVKEVSLFNLEGKKLIGLRYQNIPDYLITENLILELKNKDNLLLKHGKTAYLILLTLVKDHDKPFMIISQTLHPSFFDRILSHLEIKENLFYLKDSHNYVLLDNYSSYKFQQEKKSSRPYDLYQALVEVDERNLKIKFEEVEYSIGVIVEKNNLWGNLFAALFFMVIFSLSFILVDGVFRFISQWSPSTQWKNRRAIEEEGDVDDLKSELDELELGMTNANEDNEKKNEEKSSDISPSFSSLAKFKMPSDLDIPPKRDKGLIYEEVSNYSDDYRRNRPSEDY